MKKILKIVVALLLIAVVGFGLLIAYVVFFKPNIPVKDVKIEVTPERVARGKYLAESVAQCMDCHAERDWSLLAAPGKPGTEGKGGEAFDQKLGFPGAYYAPNITPHHLKDWSDGELMRAIVSGVSRDGRALFPIMPYTYYGKMDREDVYAIIAYIRSLKPIAYDAPASKSDFPMSIIIHIIPSKPEFSTKPAETDRVGYGKYLVDMAGCIECHTPSNKGQIIESEAFSGGRLFPLPNGTSVISTNITPDESGIGTWSEEKFFETFKKHEGKRVPLQPGQNQTIMPWTGYAGMTREDLAAIYAYLKSVKPIPSK